MLTDEPTELIVLEYMHITPPRLRPTRRRVDENTLLLLLTETAVLKLLRDGAPTLTTGIRTCRSRRTLLGLMLNDAMNMVLMPCCIGRPAKKLCSPLLALIRRNRETLHLVLRTMEPTLVNILTPN